MKEPIRTVRKSGNSLVVGLTEASMQALELKEGDLVEIKPKGKTIVIKKVEKGDK